MSQACKNPSIFHALAAATKSGQTFCNSPVVAYVIAFFEAILAEEESSLLDLAHLLTLLAFDCWVTNMIPAVIFFEHLCPSDSTTLYWNTDNASEAVEDMSDRDVDDLHNFWKKIAKDSRNNTVLSLICVATSRMGLLLMSS